MKGETILFQNYKFIVPLSQYSRKPWRNASTHKKGLTDIIHLAKHVQSTIPVVLCQRYLGHSMSSVTKKNPNLKFMSWILLEIWHYVQKTDLFLDFKFFWDWSNGFGVMTGQSFEI